MNTYIFIHNPTQLITDALHAIATGTVVHASPGIKVLIVQDSNDTAQPQSLPDILGSIKVYLGE